jgi:hypothetical protein
MWWHSHDGVRGIVMKKKKKTESNNCFKKALLILAKAGSFRPGTGDEGVEYVIHLDARGSVRGVDIAISDKHLGELFSSTTDSDE